MFLFQLLCVTGEWAKAGKQLQALVQTAQDAQMLGVTYKQALDAEAIRAAVLTGQSDMPVLVGMGGWIEGVARAFALEVRGHPEEAEGQRATAFAQAPDTPGTVDGRSFDWIADADSRFGPTFEAVVAGRYGLIPFDAVEAITIDGPHDLRDVVWLPAQIALRSGQSIAAFLPPRYPGSEASERAAILLARETDWIDSAGGQRGLGQRLWSFSDGDDFGVLQLQSIQFD